MALFTTSQTGPVNDGGTFGNTSPGVAGTDYPDPAGGDEIAFGGNHTLTVNVDCAISGNSANGGSLSTANQGTIIVPAGVTVDLEAALYYWNLELRGTVNTNGFGFGPDNSNGANYTGTQTFGGSAASPAQVITSGGPWTFKQNFGVNAHWRGTIARDSASSFLLVDFGTSTHTSAFAINREVGATPTFGLANWPSLVIRNAYSVNLNHGARATAGIDHKLLSIHWAANAPNGGSLGGLLSGTWDTATYDYKIETLVIDQRNRTTKGGNTALDVPYTIGRAILLDPPNLTGASLNTTNYATFGDSAFSSAGTFVYNSDGYDLTIFGATLSKFRWATDLPLYIVSEDDNPHLMTTEAVTMTMPEITIDHTKATGGGGDYLLISGTLAGADITVPNPLLIFTQEPTLANALNSGQTITGVVRILHGTAYMRAGGSVAQGGLWAKGESGHWGANSLEVKSCLYAGPASGNGINLINLSGLSATDAADIDYNAGVNVTDWYNNVSWSAKTEGVDAGAGGNDLPPGPNGSSVDPQFVDGGRDTDAWAVFAGFVDLDAALDAMALYGQDGWDNASDPFAADTGTIQWVRNGYKPQNATYLDAGHDGATVGAMEFAGPLVAEQFAVTGITDPVVAGVASSVTVEAQTSGGTTVTDYVGTVTFSGGGAGATLPADYTFELADAGVATFTDGVTLITAGEQTVTVVDTLDAGITGSQTGITVTPATAATLTVSGVPDPIDRYDAGDVTVEALDAYGNRDTNYTGTVTLSSTDTSADLAADHTFGGGDAGLYTFTGGVTFNARGTWAVTATDTVTGSITGAQTGITVDVAQGVNFRATAGFVTDSALHTHVLGDVFPTTRGGLRMGWNTGVLTEDADSGVAAQLAGGNYRLNNTAQRTFRVELDGPGWHDVRLALGSAATASAYQYAVLYDGDGSNVITTIDAPGGTGAGEWIDAAGTLHASAAAWVAGNAPLKHEFSNAVLRVVIVPPTSQAGRTEIAHLGVVASGAPAGGGGFGALGLTAVAPTPVALAAVALEAA